MVSYRFRIAFFGVLMVLFSLVTLAPTVSANSLPPWPIIFTGSITVNGQPAPDGSVLTGMIGGFPSVPVVVKGGRYIGLAVGAPDGTHYGKDISFHLDGLVVADQTYVFTQEGGPKLVSPFDLNFPAYPTPTPAPTSTPLPATPTPTTLSAMTISGVVEVDGGDSADFDGKELVARVGSHFSDPVTLGLNYGLLVFEDLLVDPRQHTFAGKDLQFFVDGIAATGMSAVFESGGQTDLALRVQAPDVSPVVPSASVPTAVAAATAPTAVPPAVVAVPATATSIPEPPTPVPATATSVPSPAAIPATVIPTAEPVSETAVEEGSGGGCGLAGPVTAGTGAMNSLMLFAPLLLIAAYKGTRRRNR